MGKVNLAIGVLICGAPLLLVTVGIKWLEGALASTRRRPRRLLGFGLLLGVALLLIILLPLQNPSFNLLLIPFVLSPIVLSFIFVGSMHLISFLNEREPRFLRMALIAIVLIPGIVLLGWRGATSLGESLADQAVVLGRERGDLIYDALQALNRDTGTEPGSLDRLVPAYISELPTLPHHGQWNYSAQSQTLGFQVMNRCCLLRPRGAGQWDCRKLGFFDQCAP